MIIPSSWKQKYQDETDRRIDYYTTLNERAEVRTRKMTAEEFEKVFAKPTEESCHKLKLPVQKGNDNG